MLWEMKGRGFISKAFSGQGRPHRCGACPCKETMVDIVDLSNVMRFLCLQDMLAVRAAHKWPQGTYIAQGVRGVLIRRREERLQAEFGLWCAAERIYQLPSMSVHFSSALNASADFRKLGDALARMSHKLKKNEDRVGPKAPPPYPPGRCVWVQSLDPV